MGEKIYINECEADNFMGLRRFKALFKPGVNLVKGPNGSGKTSVFNLISWLFFGRVCKQVGWRAPMEMLRQGETKGGGKVLLDGGNIEIQGVLSEKNTKGTITGKRRVLASDGVTEKWVKLTQKEVLSMVSRMGIEPGNLLSKSQAELQQAVERILGPEYVAAMLEFDRQEELLVAKRAAAKARISALGTPTRVEKVQRVNTDELDRQLAEAREFNRQQTQNKLRLERAQEDVDRAAANVARAKDVFDAQQEVQQSSALDAINAVLVCGDGEDPRELLEAWRAAKDLVAIAFKAAEDLVIALGTREEAARRAEEAAAALAGLEPVQPEKDTTELQEQRDRAGEINAQAQARVRYEEDMDKIAAEHRMLENIEEDIKDLRQRRKEAAASVQMPVEGMILTSAGLRIRNPLQPSMTLPLDQLNQAERVRVYLQIVAADDPVLRLLVLRDDNPFDPLTQQEIIEAALDLGLQVLIESKGATPEIPGACVIHVLSGRDVEADDPRWRTLAGLELEQGVGGDNK